MIFKPITQCQDLQKGFLHSKGHIYAKEIELVKLCKEVYVLFFK